MNDMITDEDMEYLYQFTVNHAEGDRLEISREAADPSVICYKGKYYLCASRPGDSCDLYRTQDVIHGPYEKIEGSFTFWDPNAFQDDDGRVYFYWGCSNMSPIRGVELDPAAMRQIGEPAALLDKDLSLKGFKRCADERPLGVHQRGQL